MKEWKEKERTSFENNAPRNVADQIKQKQGSGLVSQRLNLPKWECAQRKEYT